MKFACMFVSAWIRSWLSQPIQSNKSWNSVTMRVALSAFSPTSYSDNVPQSTKHVELIVLFNACSYVVDVVIVCTENVRGLERNADFRQIQIRKHVQLSCHLWSECTQSNRRQIVQVDTATRPQNWLTLLILHGLSKKEKKKKSISPHVSANLLQKRISFAMLPSYVSMYSKAPQWHVCSPRLNPESTGWSTQTWTNKYWSSCKPPHLRVDHNPLLCLQRTWTRITSCSRSVLLSYHAVHSHTPDRTIATAAL